MRKRSAKNPRQTDGKPYSERLGKHVGPPVVMKSMDAQIVDAAIEDKVRRLTLQGHTENAIAREIDRDVRTVKRIKARVNEEYRANHPKEIEEFVSTQLGRYNAVTRTASVRAFGGTVIERDANGREVERKIEPSIEWMNTYLKAQRQIDMLLAGRQALKIEHMGAGGGPIEVNVGPEAVARAMRERFGGAVTRTIAVPALPVSRTSDADNTDSTSDGGDSTQH
jgi:hypothetical protein